MTAKYDIKALDDDCYPDVHVMGANHEQKTALFRKWKQDDQNMPWDVFTATVQQGRDCIMVQWCGMWLGIETDGYTHS
jgi:hypothetical protein